MVRPNPLTAGRGDALASISRNSFVAVVDWAVMPSTATSTIG